MLSRSIFLLLGFCFTVLATDDQLLFGTPPVSAHVPMHSVTVTVTATLDGKPTTTSASFAAQKTQFAPPGAFAQSFYTVPDNLPSLAPGTIIRSRKITPAFLSIFPLDIDAWQILYRTNGVEDGDNPIATVATIFKPRNAFTDRLLVFATAEDSASPPCAPSHNFVLGLQQTNLVVTAELIMIILDLHQDWIVISPDYQGPDAVFGAGRMAGRAVLDSIRATLSFDAVGLTPNARVAVQGYSGGSIAAGWTAALHPTYAPEIKLVGVSTGGTPANVSHLVEHLDGTIFSGFAFAGLGGLSNGYPVLRERLVQILTPAGLAALATSKDECALSDLIRFAFAKLLSPTYTSEEVNVLADPVLKTITDWNTLGAHSDMVPTAPLLVYHSIHDEVSPIESVEFMVDQYCKAGATVQFVRDVGISEHVSMEIIGIVPAMEWLSARLAGTPAASGCSETNVTTSEWLIKSFETAWSENKVASEEILAVLTALLHAGVGTNDGIFKDYLAKRHAIREFEEIVGLGTGLLGLHNVHRGVRSEA